MDKYSIATQIVKDNKFIRTNFKTSEKIPYALYRVARPFLKLYNSFWRSRRKNVPWTSPASVRIFEKILTSDMTGFEYGSGASTRFIAKKIGKLISVEHDKEWYEKVKAELMGLPNTEYHFIPPESDNSFRTYAQFILQFPEEYFDFVLVDGRSRVECCKNALIRLKPGGILVLDNSERERYHEVFNWLGNWRMLNTTTGLTDTTFWFKPDREKQPLRDNAQANR